MIYIFERMPMPPRLNDCYGTKKNGGRYPTKALDNYYKAMGDWRKENLRLVNTARGGLVARLASHQKLLRVDRYFAFPRPELFTLAGKPQTMDVTNRIKAFDDALAAEVLGLDDAWFWSGVSEKVLAEDGVPSVMVVIAPMARTQTLQELREMEPVIFTQPLPRAAACLRKSLYPLEHGLPSEAQSFDSLRRNGGVGSQLP
jgi:hypothetical protein